MPVLYPACCKCTFHVFCQNPGFEHVAPGWGGADPEVAPNNRSAGLFNQWLDETAANGTFPDVLSWHVLWDSFDTDYNPSPRFEVPRLEAALSARGLPTPSSGGVKLMINEYGGDKSQNSPASSA